MKPNEIPEGKIDPGTDAGRAIGFDSDKFRGYLWRRKDKILISVKVSLQQGQGNLSRLMDNIINAGFICKVPNPLPFMESIVKRKGFKVQKEWFAPAKEWINVWSKSSSFVYDTREPETSFALQNLNETGDVLENAPFLSDDPFMDDKTYQEWFCQFYSLSKEEYISMKDEILQS